MTSEAANERNARWRTLEQLDDWLRTPMLLLSLAWLALVLVELLRGSSRLLEIFGIAIWAIFILEFALRFALAPEKLPFLRRNWLTVIALVVPAFRLLRGLRFLRAARALRGARLVRIVGTANRSMNALKETLRRRGFGYVAGLTALVIALGAAGMLSFEPAVEIEDGFTSYGDALWWTGMLVSTMGSAYWPATPEGRILTLLLSVYGLAVFGYITASFASYFVGRDAEAASAGPVADAEVAGLRADIAALRRELQATRGA
ncbi:MAG: ion transporter [Pseudomonadota bacterium]|nr:ion transporter [Pseudomonadota bacterium]